MNVLVVLWIAGAHAGPPGEVGARPVAVTLLFPPTADIRAWCTFFADLIGTTLEPAEFSALAGRGLALEVHGPAMTPEASLVVFDVGLAATSVRRTREGDLMHLEVTGPPRGPALVVAAWIERDFDATFLSVRRGAAPGVTVSADPAHRWIVIGGPTAAVRATAALLPDAAAE